MEHIRSNLNGELGIARLSAMAQMSPSHFSKLFKIAMGVSPHQFILRERVDRAKSLLSDSQTKIVNVAFEVGFETQAHFTTVFKNFAGVTPRQFRCTANRKIEGPDDGMSCLDEHSCLNGEDYQPATPQGPEF